MGRQLNIRSDRAVELARDLAERSGKPIARVVEEALEAYAEVSKRNADLEIEKWRAMLKQDRQFLNDSAFNLDDLYDPETGLPV